MKKSEPAAIKTDGSVKEAPVVLLRTVLEPEKKPALKTEAKAGADKPEDPAAKTADKPDPDPSKAKKPAAKPKAKAKVDVKPEPIKAEKAVQIVACYSHAEHMTYLQIVFLTAYHVEPASYRFLDILTARCQLCYLLLNCLTIEFSFVCICCVHIEPPYFYYEKFCYMFRN